MVRLIGRPKISSRLLILYNFESRLLGRASIEYDYFGCIYVTEG